MKEFGPRLASLAPLPRLDPPMVSGLKKHFLFFFDSENRRETEIWIGLVKKELSSNVHKQA